MLTPILSRIDAAAYTFFFGAKLKTALHLSLVVFIPFGSFTFLLSSIINSTGIIETNSLLLGTLLYTHPWRTLTISIPWTIPFSLVIVLSPSDIINSA